MGFLLFIIIVAVIFAAISAKVKSMNSTMSQFLSDDDSAGIPDGDSDSDDEENAEYESMLAMIHQRRQERLKKASVSENGGPQSTFRPSQQGQNAFRPSQQEQSAFRPSQQEQSTFRPSQQGQSIFRPSPQRGFSSPSQDSDGKPRVPHSTEDCTGGSIHDGYHEGSQGVQGRPKPPSAGKTRPEGTRLAGEEHSIHFAPANEASKSSAPDGADRLVAALSGKPSIIQGVIWGEILGRPRSEIE